MFIIYWELWWRCKVPWLQDIRWINMLTELHVIKSLMYESVQYIVYSSVMCVGGTEHSVFPANMQVPGSNAGRGRPSDFPRRSHDAVSAVISALYELRITVFMFKVQIWDDGVWRRSNCWATRGRGSPKNTSRQCLPQDVRYNFMHCALRCTEFNLVHRIAPLSHAQSVRYTHSRWDDTNINFKNFHKL